MEELKNAYEMSSGIGDTSGKATILLIMGDVSLKESKTDDALKYFNKAWKISRKLMIKPERPFQDF